MILVEGAARKAGIRGSRVKSGEKSTDTDLMNSPDFKARKRKASTHDVLEDEHTKTSKLSAPSQEKPRPKDNDDLPNELSSHDFTREHQIQITGVNDSGDAYIWPAPMTSFDMTPFAPPIRKALNAAGFQKPTPTQAQVWPIALAGRDVITVAKTGSGKTCGFLLPAFHRLLAHLKDRRRGPPGILVLAPTRELACQIEEECVKFGRSSNIRSVCAYGGAPKSSQVRKIQGGIEILIATPGRLNDLLEMKVVDLALVVFLVLDEADRMLDMGFEPQIRLIIAKLPRERQSMMFTATWPREIQTIAKDFLRSPIEIKFGISNKLNANKAITQIIKVVSEDEKSGELKKILQLINPSGTPVDVPKTIIFVARKSTCDNLANKMWNAGFPVDSLHGDKEQFQRTKVMDLFKKSQLRILVATDVAARGLDVKDIAVIINFDFPVGPSSVEDYVHRIGRTARGDAEGKAFTFFTQSDAKSATQLIGVLERAEQQVPEELRRLDRSGGTGGGGGSGGRGGRRDSQSGSGSGSGRGRGRGRGGGSGTKK